MTKINGRLKVVIKNLRDKKLEAKILEGLRTWSTKNNYKYLLLKTN